ncbi:hypothetical protein JET14_13525 [Martelella lutilitoris]|uniref:Uncharacterized protein n=1 Tax=Martelella lutilitoris TaxID=2583532 RepID=A0A7T7KKX8_9HYPH|nr:hypothetical protein [Martelella lutilitoris]QQM29344.1 hypothetical protein JET14_13525 [Martelella lutilitoris]
MISIIDFVARAIDKARNDHGIPINDKTYIPKNLYKLGKRAGFDMSGYAVQKLTPTHKEESRNERND